MESSGEERASARMGEVFPDNCMSAFGRIAAAIDNLERMGWDRIEGLTDHESCELSTLEGCLHALRPPTSAADRAWLALRLGRAFENNWHGGAVRPLLNLLA